VFASAISVVRVLHFSASGLRSVTALFFMLGRARCGFHKKCVGTRYTKLLFLHQVGSTGHIVQSDASRPRNIDTLFFMLLWAQWSFPKKHDDKLRRTCVFASGGICGSPSVFRSMWAGEHRPTIFHAQVGPVQFP
jgi:hypothetical protein